VTGGSTAAISSVTTANSAIFYLGCTTSSSADGSHHLHNGYLKINSSTQVGSVGGTSSTIGFVVVEFQASVLAQSTQQKIISIASADATTNTTITAVGTYGILAYGGFTETSSVKGNSLNRVCPIFKRTSTTNIEATRLTSGASITCEGVVTAVDFNAGVLASVDYNQGGTVTTTTNTTLSSAAENKTAVSFLGVRPTAADGFASDMDYHAIAMDWNSTTQVQAQRSIGSTTSQYCFERLVFA
jgi:hypothetical protein